MNEHTVALTRVFDAPRSRVFECWTRAEHLQHWFGPKGFTIHSCETDPRPGGVFKLCMRAPDGKDYWVRGEFSEVDTPKRLVITCSADDDKGVERLQEVIDVTFTESQWQDYGGVERNSARAERRSGRDAQGNGQRLGPDRRPARAPI